MTSPVTARDAAFLAHPRRGYQTLHIIEHLANGGRQALTGVADGAIQWRKLGPGEEPDHRDGIAFPNEWVDHIRQALAGEQPPAESSHTLDEIRKLRAEVQQWRTEFEDGLGINIDRDRVDRIIDQIRCER